MPIEHDEINKTYKFPSGTTVSAEVFEGIVGKIVEAMLDVYVDIDHPPHLDDGLMHKFLLLSSTCLGAIVWKPTIEDRITFKARVWESYKDMRNSYLTGDK